MRYQVCHDITSTLSLKITSVFLLLHVNQCGKLPLEMLYLFAQSGKLGCAKEAEAVETDWSEQRHIKTKQYSRMCSVKESKE